MLWTPAMLTALASHMHTQMWSPATSRSWLSTAVGPHGVQTRRCGSKSASCTRACCCTGLQLLSTWRLVLVDTVSRYLLIFANVPDLPSQCNRAESGQR